MAERSIQECNKKCRAKYSNWNEDDLRKKLLEINRKVNPFHVDNLPKDGLIVQICTVECGVIEEGW